MNSDDKQLNHSEILTLNAPYLTQSQIRCSIIRFITTAGTECGKEIGDLAREVVVLSMIKDVHK